MSGLLIFSGNCLFCESGTETPYTDMNGKTLFTGDIVVTFTVRDGEFLGLGLPDSLTVVVRDEYQNWAGQSPEKLDEPGEFFVMGIKSVPLDEEGEWRVLKVKDHSGVVPGERWPAWGFHYEAATPEIGGSHGR